MNYTIKAGLRSGRVSVPSSKSYAHRQLICAALSNSNTTISCKGLSKDIVATAGCLRALGAGVDVGEGRINIEPVCGMSVGGSSNNCDEGGKPAGEIVLDCNESGSTLRFLLPVVAALGISATFKMADGLAARPVDVLLGVMEAHGVRVTKGKNTISLEGKMSAGEYMIPGNISSQYVSGLLFALPLLDDDSTLTVTGDIESRDYISITEDTLSKSGISFTVSGGDCAISDSNSDTVGIKYLVPGNQQYRTGQEMYVEQDWSNAAFFMCMGALSEEGITIEEMPVNSNQGDREIINVLETIGADITFCGSEIKIKRKELKALTVDAGAIPDLVPTIAALSSLCEGTTVIKNAHRLRIKESDRLASTSGMLKALGADITELEDGLIIEGQKELSGGTIDACNDHRIAMAAAVAACGCRGDVTVIGAQCVAKSYPQFWEDLEQLNLR